MSPVKARKRAQKRVLWITDPWNTLDHSRDTSLRLAEEMLAQGVQPHWASHHSILLEKGEVLLEAHAITGIFPGRAKDSFALSPAEAARPRDFDQILYRVDPPVDHAYLHPLQLIAFDSALGARRPEIVNPAPILALDSEKFLGAALPELFPEGVVASSVEHLERFIAHAGRAVLKPLHQAQSKGIELLDKSKLDAEEIRARLARATGDFTAPVLLQQFLPGIAEGETRLWYLDGKLLAHARKLPLEGDFRVNIDQGSRLAQSRLTAREKKAAAKIGTLLRARRIRLAAVDLIEGLITDSNFTSPGLITQMESLLGENLARPIVRALLKR